MQRIVLAVIVLASLVSSAQNKPPAYQDPSLPAATRAHDLVNRMTLDEKASQLEDWAIAIPRLGVPDYQTWSEALHGVARLKGLGVRWLIGSPGPAMPRSSLKRSVWLPPGTRRWCSKWVT